MKTCIECNKEKEDTPSYYCDDCSAAADESVKHHIKLSPNEKVVILKKGGVK